MIKAENLCRAFPISSGAPCALASLFTSVQLCLEMLIHSLSTLLLLGFTTLFNILGHQRRFRRRA